MGVCEIDGCAGRAKRRCAGRHVCSKHGHRYDRHQSFDAMRAWGAPNPEKQVCAVAESDFGPYSTDVEQYVPRCVPCHKRFDLAAIA